MSNRQSRLSLSGLIFSQQMAVFGSLGISFKSRQRASVRLRVSLLVSDICRVARARDSSRFTNRREITFGVTCTRARSLVKED